MPDLLVPIVLAWIVIGTGLLFYFPPPSIAARRIRVVVLAAMLGLAVAMFLHIDIPNTSGRAYVAVGLPFGGDAKLYYPYGYFCYRLFPVFLFALLSIATVGPLIYLLKTRRDSARR